MAAGREGVKPAMQDPTGGLKLRTVIKQREAWTGKARDETP